MLLSLWETRESNEILLPLQGRLPSSALAKGRKARMRAVIGTPPWLCGAEIKFIYEENLS